MNQKFKDINRLLNMGIESRNADGSINGYLYQFELTLYHMLLDKTPYDPFGDNRSTDDDIAVYEIESVEDYIKYFSEDDISHIRVAQIKYHSGSAGPMDYAKALIYLYYGYLRYVSSNLVNTTYRMVIFHHDKSTSPRAEVKNVSIILERALPDILENYIAGNLKSLSKGEAAKIDEILEFILINDTANMREKFANHASFIWSSARGDLITNIKNELMNRYYDLNVYKGNTFKEEFYYALALSKLINDFRQKGGKEERYGPTSIEDFDRYFREFNVWDIIKLIEVKLSHLMIEYIENIAYTEEETMSTEQAQLVEDYQNICGKILEFMISKLSTPQNRLSFFNTIIPKKFTSDRYNTNGPTEWEMFLENIRYVEGFIVKLAKMMYFFHKKYMSAIDLEQWFEVGTEVWKFHFPLDQRRSGVIIGSIPEAASPDKAVGELKMKLSEMNIRVWYLCPICTSKNRGQHQYRHSINEPNLQAFIIDKPSVQIFTIECLSCLGLNKYEDYSDIVGNVFEEGCLGAK